MRLKHLLSTFAAGGLFLAVMILVSVQPQAPIEAAEGNSYYVAEWVWDKSDPDMPHWRTPYPDITAGLIDMRTLPQMAEAGPGPQCCMLLALNAPPPGLDPSLTPLGNNLDNTVALSSKSGLESRLALDSFLPTMSLRETIYELLMFRGDPTGETAWKPLLPGSDRRIRIYLGGSEPLTIRQTGPLSPEWPVIREVLRTDFVGIKAASLARGDEQHRLVLGGWVEKYGLSAEEIIPGETALPPSTIIGDTFVEAGNTALGSHTATGPNGGFGWTVVIGTMTVLGASDNLAIVDGGANTGRADSDLSGNDMDAEIDVTTHPSDENAAAGVRFNSAADTAYFYIVRSAATNTHRLFKRITGSFTLIGPAIDEAAPGVTYNARTRIDGSSLSGFLDDGLKIGPETDGAISGNLRGGIYGTGTPTSVRVDNFEATDLAAATRRIFIVTDGRRRRRAIPDRGLQVAA